MVHLPGRDIAVLLAGRLNAWRNRPAWPFGRAGRWHRAVHAVPWCQHGTIPGVTPPASGLWPGGGRGVCVGDAHP